MKRMLVLLIALSLMLAVAGCTGKSNEPSASDTPEAPKKVKFVVGGKGFTEQFVLAQLMAQLLQNNENFEVSIKDGLQSSAVQNQAMIDGDIQVASDYTGTMYLNVLKMELAPDDTAETVFQKTKDAFEKQMGLTLLEPLGFANTFTLILRKDKAEELNVKTMSDLVQYAPNLTIGMDTTFYAREDGYQPFVKEYGFNFKSHKEMDISLAFKALDGGEIDVLVAYSTDGRISALNLTMLEDDKGFFPPYDCVPIVNKDFLNANPEVGEILNQLVGKLDALTMSELNAKVDMEKREPKDVAHEFLVSAGLIK